MRRVPQDVDDAFYSGARSDAIPLVVNDAVEIINGEYSGRCGAVISLESVDPDLTFLVELGDSGEDVVAQVGSLRRVESNG